MAKILSLWALFLSLLVQVTIVSAHVAARFENVTTPTSSSTPSTITSAPTSSSCATCFVGAGAEAGGLAIVVWNPDIITLTMDTVSPYVVQYNNTQITMTTTYYGNLSTIEPRNVSQISTLVSLADMPYYNPVIDFVSGTASAYSSGTYTTTLLYPDSYAWYTAVGYNTSKAGECLDPHDFGPVIAVASNYDDLMKVQLAGGIYAPIDSFQLSQASMFGVQGGECPSSMFSQSDALSSLKSALGFDPSECQSIYCSGQPSYKVPVSALTSTATMATLTITSGGIYSPTISPSPQDTVSPPTVSQSSTKSSSAPTNSPIPPSSSTKSSAGPSSEPASNPPTSAGSVSPTESSPTVSSPTSNSQPEGGSSIATPGSSPATTPNNPGVSVSTVSYFRPTSPAGSSESSSSAIVIGGTTYTAGSSGGYSLPGGTVYPFTTTTISGTPYYLSSSQLVSGTVTLSVIAAATTPGSGYFQVGSQTLSAGGTPVVVSGTTYSIEPSGSAVVIAVGGSSTTSALPTAGSGTATPVIVIGSSTYTEVVPTSTPSSGSSGNSGSSGGSGSGGFGSSGSSANSTPTPPLYTGDGNKVASNSAIGHALALAALILLI